MKLIKYGIPKRFGCIVRNIKWAFQMRKGVKYKENSELPKPILQFTFYLGIDHNDAVLDTA